MSHQAYRRVFGTLLGLILGLAFGIISQSMNFIFLPGIPLEMPPFGPFINALLSVLIGSIIGFVLAWPETGALGVMLASAAAALVISLAALFTGKTSTEAMISKIGTLLLIFLPLAGMAAPLMIVLRWIMAREENHLRETAAGLPPNRLARFGLPAGLIVVTIVLAVFIGLLPERGRIATPRMQSLIVQGQQAASQATLPKVLRQPNVRYFAEQAHGPYTLSWSLDETNTYAIPRPAGASSQQSTVVAHFESGYLLVCVFPGATGDPSCRDFIGTPDFLKQSRLIPSLFGDLTF